MTTVHTKNLNGVWYCYATYNGLDISFCGTTRELVQGEMKKTIKNEPSKWAEVEIINDPKQVGDIKVIIRPTKIDNNPIA